MFEVERGLYGDANWADARMRRSAGINVPQGAYIGHDAAGRRCYSDQQSAILVCGGARSLKGSVVQPWMVDGFMKGPQGQHHLIWFDTKAQDTVVGSLQVRQGRHLYCFNPRANGEECRPIT